jgi:hypothetical protein
MSVIAVKYPRRLEQQSMTRRREHGIGEYDLRPPDGLLRYRGPEGTLLGSIQLHSWPGACVRSSAREILTSPGARALPGFICGHWPNLGASSKAELFSR